MTNDVALQSVGRALHLIGYRRELLQRDYEYADVAGGRYLVRRAPLAGFAQTPPSYRNACVGVIVSNGLSGKDHVIQCRALGAPMIFEVGPSTVGRWKVTSSGDPEFIESIRHDEIEQAFSAHREDWNPDRVLRAKAIIADPLPRQLDFIDLGLMPALEGMIHRKLDRLLQDTHSRVIKAYKRYNNSEPAPDYLFRLVFRLIAAKVFRDRKFPGRWDSDDPAVILKAVEEHYNSDSQNVRLFPRYRREVAEIAWREISSAFHFQNLSVDDLAFIYENTFITPQIRKKLGTHSTPLFVAEYIIRKLPFEELPEKDRRVLEPFSGGGIFLLTAMRRLRELLSSNLSDASRHRYFINRLTGIEVDAFALEVCRLSLILADYPNPDGWRLYNEDVFATERLERELKRSEIVLCNPPFENFGLDERQPYGNAIECIQKPAELLRRVLLTPPRLLGLVLPLTFNTGNSYRSFHHQLARTYGQLELTELPEVFNFSDAPTTLLTASDRRDRNVVVAVSCRAYTDEAVEALFMGGRETPAVTELLNVPEHTGHSFSLWIPRLSRIWRCLEGLPILEQVADIHQGIHWKGRKKERKRGERRTDVISDHKRPGFKQGVARVEDYLAQYSIRGSQYLSLRPEDQENKAYQYPWDKPKVVCNAARLSRSASRVGAVADPVGLAFSKQFFAFWPNTGISIYALSALLNSPIANAWSFSHDLQVDNRIQTLRALPIPSSTYLALGEEIEALSRELHQRFQEDLAFTSVTENGSLKKLLLRLDAAILKAYDLPPVLERELLDLFQGAPRPAPFEFNGYYPRNFTAYLPLHELLSEEFQEARIAQSLERLEPVYDSKISEMITWLTQS